MDAQEILKKLSTGDFAFLIGQRETDVFEAKGPVPYDLSDPVSRFELAKDVSAFANSAGGIIVIGLGHEAVPSEDTEQVNEVALLALTDFPANSIWGVLKSLIYPHIAGLQVGTFAALGDSTKGLGYIYVPPQAEEAKLFLITKVVEEGVALKENVFGIVRRVKAHNVPLQAHEMARYIRDGRSPNAQRLTRIEAKLDALLGASEASATPAEFLEDRLKDI